MGDLNYQTNGPIPPPQLSLPVGLFFTGLGAAILFLAFHAPDRSLEAPRWMVGLGGLLFLLTGFRFLECFAIKLGWFAESQLRTKLSIALLITMFAVGAFWAAFDPGDVHVSVRAGAHAHLHEASRPVAYGFQRVLNVFGQVAFFMGAVITTILAVFCWREVIRQFRAGRAGARTDGREMRDGG